MSRDAERMLAQFRAEAARERDELRADLRAEPNEPSAKPTPTAPNWPKPARWPLGTARPAR